MLQKKLQAFHFDEIALAVRRMEMISCTMEPSTTGSNSVIVYHGNVIGLC